MVKKAKINLWLGNSWSIGHST